MSIEKSVEHYQKFQLLNTDDLLNNVSRFHDLGLKLIPLTVNSHQRFDDGYLDHVDRLATGFLPYIFEDEVALAVELGSHSRNLFAVACNSQAEYENLRLALPEYVKWVTTEGDKYNIWLFSEDATILEDKQFENYEVKSKGSLLLPPSRMPDGQCCVWIDREGNRPPSLCIDEIQELFPGMSLQTAKRPRQLGDPVFIKSELIKQAMLSAITQWPGRSGSSLMKVYVACCWRADQEDITCFRATAREIADLTATSPSTASLMLNQLVGLRLIERLVKEGTEANYYGLIIDQLPQSSIPSWIANYMLPILNHDAFNRGALGPSAAQVLISLLSEPQLSLMDLASECGRGYSTVRLAIKQLHQYGLAYKKNGKWFARLPTTNKLTKIAEELGSLGNYRKRKYRHREERRTYAARKLLWAIREQQTYVQ